MGLTTHFQIWNKERYTDAQKTEFRQLRALYQRYLSGVRGGDYPYLLQLQDENREECQPAYGQIARKAEDAKTVQPSGEGLQPFTQGMVAMVGVFAQRRQRRFFGKGYPNDPTSLLGYYLREEFEKLGALAANQGTLDRVLALKNFLEAIRRGQIFTQEPEGHGSLSVLMRNLVAKLALLETHVRDEMALESAREHFKQLKSTVNQILDQSVRYLFSAVSEKSRTDLSLSLLSAPSGVVDENLHASLQTREGTLLKNLVQHPDMLRALFPQRSKAVNTFGPPLGLMGEVEGTPFIEAKGQAHPLWLDFLQKIPEQEAQLDPAFSQLPVGVSSVILADAKASDETQTPALANFVRLHGLVLTLARFQNYVESCWQLAGLGGDQLLYGRLAETITTVLSELLHFNQALRTTLAEFQGQLDALDAEAFNKKADKAWQHNYEQAKACHGAVLKLLGECEITLNKILAHAQDSAARSERLQAGSEALQRLQGAQDFLNQARYQIGRVPALAYPGLTTSPSAHPPVVTLTTFEALLLVLMPQAPQQVIALTQVCTATPSVLPWAIFRGTCRRAAYLQRTQRLLSLGEGIARLEQYPGYAASAEGRAAIQQLKINAQAELTRIARLSQGLYWPFHRTSRAFFADWQNIFQENARRLQALESRYPAPEIGAAPTQRNAVESASLLPAVLTTTEPTEQKDYSSRLATLWAKTLEQEAFWQNYTVESTEEFDPASPAEFEEETISPRLGRLSVTSEANAALQEEPDAADFSFQGFFEQKKYN